MWAPLWNAVEMAIAELWRNRARTALTSLGILIGVGSVIAMVGLGQGATASIQEDLSSFGVNLVMLQSGVGRGPQARAPAPPLRLSDADAILTQVPHVAGVAPVVASPATAVTADARCATSVQGSSADYLAVMGRTLAHGRTFTEGEARAGASVCLLGETVRAELFGERPALGGSVRLGKVQCTVIGLIAPAGENTMGMDQDDYVLLPIRAVQRRMVGSADVSTIFLSADSAGAIDQVERDLDVLMRHRRNVTGDNTVNFEIHDTREMAATLGSITGVLTAFLAAVAGVSLLVGGIGIMNIMLVSVTERTREIGIRMSVGALEADIRTQFLVEAMVLASFGGVLGVLLGLAGTALGAWALGIPFVLRPLTVALSVTFSAVLGVGFGWVPAGRAARLEPIDALRHA